MSDPRDPNSHDDFRVRIAERNKQSMRQCLDFIKEKFPEMGFAVFVFEFGDDPDRAMHWGSNAQRQDMLKALQEFMRKQAS